MSGWRSGSLTGDGQVAATLAQADLPEDVKDVFQALKKASENHLAAFQRNLDKPGDGQASRSGNRWSDDINNKAFFRLF
jgi:hypothetical protein